MTRVATASMGCHGASNPHWPVWAARELGHSDRFSLVPEDWAWWLRNFGAHESCICWPVVEDSAKRETNAA